MRSGVESIFVVNQDFTWDKKEIDLVEEREGRLFAYEFKYRKKKSTAPKMWKESYPNSNFSLINQTNYLDFLL